MTTFEPPQSQDKLSILKRVPIFASCTPEQLSLIVNRTRLVEYKKGEIIYRQGDPANAFYMISSGRLRIFSVDGPQEHTIAILHNGDSFGEVSLLTGENHSATVQTLNDTLILELEKKDFDDVINRIPSLVLYLSRLLSKRLRTKEHGVEFAEATIVGIYAAVAKVGRSCFAMALAHNLNQETGHPVVVVNISKIENSFAAAASSPVAASRLSTGALEALESAVENAIVQHPLGFSVLEAATFLDDTAAEQAIAPLLGLLTQRFRYILLDLPNEMNPSVVKALVQSDLVYVVTSDWREHIIRTNALIHQLQSIIAGVEQRLKTIITITSAPDQNTTEAPEKTELSRPASYTLPFVPSLAEGMTVETLRQVLNNRGLLYTATVRHMARELGGLLVGLALGSGAALGLAHVGILKIIEREKIPIDVIAGTSIGALVAALWASGKSAAELEEMALRFKNPWQVRKLFLLDLGIPIFSVVLGIIIGAVVSVLAGFWTGLLLGFMVASVVGIVLGPLSGGPIQGSRLTAKLQEDFAGKTFADTWLPLKIVAANPMAREEIVFESGSLVDAVRASVSIPGIFKPVIYKGKVCLDGGVINPVPVTVLKRAGVNHVIAVNVFPTTPEFVTHLQEIQRRRVERDAQLASRSLPARLFYRIRQELIRSVSPLVFDVIMRSMQLMEYQISEISCRDADITLRPTVIGSHWLEFFSPEKFIRRGEEVALENLEEIKRIAHMRSVDKLS